MTYIEENLVKNEEIVYLGKIHWMVFHSSLLSYILVIIAPNGFMTMILFPIYIFVLFFNSVSFFGTECGITNKRIIFKKGLFIKETIEINYEKIESIMIDQGIIERIFNYGTVIIIGTGGTTSKIKGIKDPITFKNKYVNGFSLEDKELITKELEVFKIDQKKEEQFIYSHIAVSIVFVVIKLILSF
jgi:uncharacterized membrane protein YdbT with pleckstrin-like domain